MRTILLGLFFVAASVAPGFCEEPPSGDDAVTVNSVFERFGFETHPDITNGRCVVTSTVDRKAFVESFPTLQKMQLMNDEITQAQLNLKPNTLAMGFELNMMPVAIKEVYETHKDVNKCHFTGRIKIFDDYGNEKTIDVMSFDFTRAINARVNWNNFQAQNLFRIAPHFQFTPAMAGFVALEKAASEGND